MKEMEDALPWKVLHRLVFLRSLFTKVEPEQGLLLSRIHCFMYSFQGHFCPTTVGKLKGPNLEAFLAHSNKLGSELNQPFGQTKNSLFLLPFLSIFCLWCYSPSI